MTDPAPALITAASAHARSRALLPLRTLAGFAIAVAAVLAIAVISYGSISSNQEAAARASTTIQVLERLQAMLSGLKDAETGQRGYLLTGAEAYLEPFTAAKAAHGGHVQQLRKLLQNPRQVERLDTVAQLASGKFDELQQTIDRRRRGDTEGALSQVQADFGKVTMDRIRQVTSAMINDAQATLAQRQALWQETAELASAVSIGGSALLLVLTLLAAVVAVRDHRRRSDDSWVQVGQTTLAQLLQGEQRLDVLGQRVLGFLADTVQAHVGALYVCETGGRLRRGGLALDPQALPPELYVGDGLLGQVAQRGTLLHVTDVPEGYLPVHSATGRGTPRQLVILPARHEGSVQAVIELGFLQQVGPAELALLDRVSGQLAVAVSAARDRSQLEQLLEETQRQAEELQAQQEELRVSNEELEQQSRVLRESQVELETQQSELERVNGQLGQHARTLEQQQRALLVSQAELRDNAQALETASRYKSEFLANMSHELRTPLNSSLILSRLLMDNKPGTLDVEQVRYARAIHDANNDLLALINDILDLAKIEAGHADLQAEDVQLAELTQRLRMLFEAQAQQKGLQFTIETAADAPPHIQTDGQRLAQVLKNLLANALKFTAKGSVSLAVHAAPDGGVRFDVRDTGMGIAPDKHQLIFEAFRQADGSTSRQFGGTGLGLSISRELVLRLGGQIALASTPGQGSCFSLTLPAQMPTQMPAQMPAQASRDDPARPLPAAMPSAAPPTVAVPSAPPAAASATAPTPPLVVTAPDRGRRVLLAVEDDHAFAEVLRGLVHEAGFDCVIASGGAQALALARELRPAGVLLDVGLPDVSGLSVLEQLKRDPATRHIPVHLVSATERSASALALGAIGHVVKPAAREQLMEAIERLRDRADLRLRRLLVVEDDATLRVSLERLLAGPGIEIVTVGTVADALQALELARFDCMVTDLALPDGTGFDLLEGMAAQAAATGSVLPPVIVYTGRALNRDEEARLRRYSRSIIVKGARSPERLLDEVTLFLHSVESALPGEQQRLLRAARQRDAVLEGRRILLAEDDVRNIFALTSVFEPLGATLEIARNGREALERVQRQPAIDLVLMDVMMPEMDGLTAMRLIRQQPGGADVPIIALTAKAMADDRQQCLDAGANDYLAKPIDIDRLVSLCRVWMPK